MSKIIGRIWVGGTLLLITFISYSSQIFIILPLLNWNIFDPHAIRLLLPFNLLVGMVYWNYWLCMMTDPGGVPKGWEPPKHAEETGTIEVKKLTGGPRYCRTCKAYKPPRTHHCRQCKRCILKMDHHCPWVNNCVGYHNYGHFIRFLFFVDVACAYHIWLISKRIFGEFRFGPDPSSRELIFLILNYVTSVPVLLAVGMFSIYHFWCMLSNTTTIEGWEKDKAATLRRRGRIQEFKFPYSLGAIGNARAVLGNSPLLWCWPRPVTGDGLSFATSADVDPASQYNWPPRDLHARSGQQALRRHDPAPLPLQPFTYGDALNPALVPSNGAQLRQRLNRSNVPPYHPDNEPPDEVDLGEESDSARIAVGHVSDDDDDDDEQPLSELADLLRDRLAHGGTTDQNRARVRRGSEGYEVRPVGNWQAQAMGDEAAVEDEDDSLPEPSDGYQWVEEEVPPVEDAWDDESGDDDGPAWTGNWSD